MEIGFVGIDPGNKGAIVCLRGSRFQFWEMPLTDENVVDFDLVNDIVHQIHEDGPAHAFLERAVSFGMGTKGAFTYGRSFQALLIGLTLGDGIPLTYIEPAKWTKEMHEGIEKDLKAKAKSIIAVKRLFPKLAAQIPVIKGKMHEGVMDGLLIAAYAKRKLVANEKISIKDF